jgi:hypothetical protein
MTRPAFTRGGDQAAEGYRAAGKSGPPHIGLENVKLQPTEPIAEPRLGEFRAALIDNQEKIDLYRGSVAPVTFLGEHLFRADMFFPGQCPDRQLFGRGRAAVGRRGGQRADDAADRQPDRLFQRRLHVVAHRHAVLYGAGALIFAVAAGWAAGAIFQEGVSMVETVAPRVFLVVVDESAEMPVALYYASRRAQRTCGRVALLRVIPREESHGLASVEALMREEAQQEAEQLLQRLARTVVDEIGVMPILYMQGRLAARRADGAWSPTTRRSRSWCWPPAPVPRVPAR